MAIKYGGIISPDNLELQRKSGQKDDAIADQMAQASPTFASQLSKIRKKYGGDSAATTAFLNTRFYGAVDHSPEQPKGIVGRSLERIYQNYKKDIVDVGQALENRQQGKQGFIDTTAQVAGNLMSIAASPVAQPFQEAVGTVAKGAYENIPGVKPALQSLGQSSIVQKGVLPAIQGTSQFLQEESARNPALRSLGAVGEGLSDLTDAYAGGALAKGAYSAAKPAIGGALQGAKGVVTSPFQTLGKAAGATARIGSQPIRSGFKGFMQGIRGQSDDVTKQIAQGLDNATMELTGSAKEAVKAGMDEKVIKYAVQQSPETRKAMSAMTKAAKEGSAKLGGDTAHKEILGSYMLNNLDHVLTEKDVVGKALGAMKKGMKDEVIDMTDDLVNFRNELTKVGAVINEKGQITRLAAEADDNIPLLQEALNFLQPDDAGRVVKRFEDVDMWRSKMFKEMNSAKAKLQPSAAGQSTFGYSEKVVNNLRRSAIENAADAYNPRLLAYNDAFEELATQSSSFLKKIGYKGKLDIDSITSKDLKTAEIALRSLGAASADTKEAFSNLIKTARKHGFDSGVDEDALIRWADEVENLFPVTPTRSLAGVMTRTSAQGGQVIDEVAEQVIKKKGLVRGGLAYADEKALGVYKTLRGMTPENQYKLLLEVLDASDDTPMVKLIDNVVDNVSPSVKQAVQGVDAGDVKNAAQNSIDDLANLTPEEKATGLIGGSDSPKNIPLENAKVYNSPIEAMNDPVMQAKYAAANKAMKNGKVTKTSNNLYHTTSAENLESIRQMGLTTGNKARFEGVSSPDKISFSANEAGASYYGKQGDVMIRTKTSYKPDDLELDLLAGGEGTYTTGKNIPAEMLQVKQGSKWVDLKDYKPSVGGGLEPLVKEATIKKFSDLADQSKKMTLGEFVNKYSEVKFPKSVTDDLVKLGYGADKKFGLEKVWNQFNPSFVNPNDLPF